MPLPTIPPLLYGTAWKDTRTGPLLLAALQAGFRGIDTAGQRKHYREDLVGQALQQAEEAQIVSRSDVWIQTKYTPPPGQDLTGPVPYDPSSPVRAQVRSSALASLKNLHPGAQWDWSSFGPAATSADRKGKGRALPGDDEAGGSATSSPAPSAPGSPRPPRRAGERKNVAWLDSYLLHSPLRSLEETLEAWREMEALVDEGWTRHIGFSNVYDSRIWSALLRSVRIRPFALQNRWHSTSGHDVSLLATLSPALSPNDGDVPIVYQPFWTLTGNPSLLNSTPVLAAAERLHWTRQQVVYRFVAQGLGVRGIQAVVLSGTTDEQHMDEVVAAVQGSLELTEEEVDAIRKCVYGE